jgi:very-short-patch-repair endonuclease
MILPRQKFSLVEIKGKQMYGYDFHRKKPIDNYILDFLSRIDAWD